MKKLSFRSCKDLSLFFKAKRAFCSATFMSYFSPSLLCPLLLGSSLLPFSRSGSSEQPFFSSSWERKNTLPCSSLFPFCTSSSSLSAQQIASVELPHVSGGRAALGGMSCTSGRWEGQQEHQSSLGLFHTPTSSTGHVSKNISRHLSKSRAAGPWCS